MIGTCAADNLRFQPKDISNITGQFLDKDKLFLSDVSRLSDKKFKKLEA